MVADQMAGVPARTAQDHGPLAITSRKRRSHSASDHLPTSPNTPRKRILVYGSKTSGSPTELEEWMMTTSSFNTSPSAWESMFEHGLNSSHLTASATGRISRGSSSETSRGHTFVLAIPRTSRAASRSPTSSCGITSVGSQNDATPFLTSSMRTSLACFSLRQPVSL